MSSEIPGDPDALAELARRLGTLARGMGEGSERLSTVHSGQWRGHGGTAFRGLLGEQPGKFATASDAFGQASGALARHAVVLSQAQQDAGVAAAQHSRGQAATDRWHGHGVDPGAADRSAATTLLADARDRVDVSARRAAAALLQAEQGAPHKPSLLHRAISGVTHLLDGKRSLGKAMLHVGEGMIDGIADMAKGTWNLTGALCTDPGRFARSWAGLLAVAGLSQRRRAFAQSFVDWSEWSKDPARALGHTGVNVGTTLMGGEGLFAKAGDILPAVTKVSPEMEAASKATEADPALVDGFPAWRGLTEHANWAQKKYSAIFSKGGPFTNCTVDSVAADLRFGVVKPTDLAVDIIRRGDSVLILNTRSSHALMAAGIPRSEWIVKDVTGNLQFEDRLSAQLKRNKLGTDGVPSARQSQTPMPEGMLPIGWPHSLPPQRVSTFDWRTLGLAGPFTDQMGSRNGTGLQHR